ncbi:signal peptide peptidase SppA, 36K type [Ehrlichia chaffeensis str. Heartland]|uniref:Signal peptide peptidase SppA n=1 Tax=Ehrlichia chaffeensis (strain ATCC CRL-10679 / Arkansas) TaxID=205920 RepID=Q2GH62_EHRCR|nr:signal peptide peptidase SppA [Ehrlichia chaffeensis]ABD45325.1 signal peptide peptidase SppA [Ehrlichia chaffeensis str. Arkansas]AHX03505.1 signal peptide peptidase SppA, 36K type [Ehrlichia chaffeensis str. Heartland]AHX05774.1 signal peptide peptidase SppA, 36K type [Ehrlichia chaffeensis str. Jax]AHX06766.1 signal peptide peptidase SppA, 36K type [Ehrlichia chaffeensis str. Liberty]AHX07204.1 signal peptide peptidase SppA, 36K type [Ehrlichia chaffeensis str. Osceola]
MSDQLLKIEVLNSKVKLWRVFAFFMIFVLLMLVNYIDISKISSFLDNEYIAKVNIEGKIETNEEMDALLKKIAEDNHVTGLILNINSPGGSVTGSEILYQNIRNVSKNKPVVALLNDFAASGGYMTAIAADYIIARHTTITGSIGVLMQYIGINPLAEKMGISLKSIKSSNLKAETSPFEELTEEKEESIRRIIKNSYDYFVDIVADRRKMEKDQVLKIANGSIYTGSEALSIGLVDQIGGQDEAMNWFHSQNISTQKVKVLSKKKHKSIIENVSSFISQVVHYYINK